MTFQLTRSRGAWQYGSYGELRVILFQLTRSRGAWLSAVRMWTLHWHFNSHAHVERDAQIMVHNVSSATFQLTRSRGAWPKNSLVTLTKKSISTHTLTWSVTLVPCALKIWKSISTHTLTWSVTHILSGIRLDNHHFNSHAHVERDLTRWLKICLQSLFQLTRSRGAWRISSAIW